MKRVHYFGAGPAAIPREVLEQAQAELLDFQGAGVSVLEIHHRAPAYSAVHEELIAGIRDLLALPSQHHVILQAGGGRLQFALAPLNLVRPRETADYILTGRWSEVALRAAEALGAGRVAATTAGPEGYTRVPSPDEIALDPRAVYCHFTSNNTIEGVQFHRFPTGGDVPLAADMTSDFLSRPFDPAPFGLIYAAAQKNLGTAGLSVVVIRDDLLERARADLPEALQYRTHAATGSLYSTPPVFAVYIAALTVRWIKARGGLGALAGENEAKASLLYSAIDDAGGFYRCPVEPASRSTMNVVFSLAGPEQDAAFVAEAESAGLLGVRGHRSRGGIRVSLYNGVTLAAARAVADFTRDFARRRG